MVTVIGEAGKNFILEGTKVSVKEALENAKVLALTAKEAGCDVVKFQCHVAKDEIGKRHPNRATWIKLNEKLTPFKSFWKPLKEYCDDIEIEFLCTPMSKMAAQKINPLVKRWKVASPDLRDGILLKYLKRTKKPIILSSGMSDLGVIARAKYFLEDNFKILHCVSEYPLAVEKSSLEEMLYYDGLSDHTQSLITGALAVAKNAEIIEKHFTVNNWGKDAHMSLNPEQLKQYVSNIREADKACSIIPRPTEKEKELLKEFWYEKTDLP